MRQRVTGAAVGRFAFRRHGRDLLIEGPLHWRYFFPDITVGDQVFLGPRVTFDIPPGGRVRIGNRVNLTQDILISASVEISIGDDTLIGEYVSIRDADHGKGLGTPIHAQPLIAAPVSIGRDVWIGRGVAILKGVTIGDGAVVGANAVVTSDVPSLAIVGGVPARVISTRS
jgi:acetyltransferase-like isoleucine patch superfamily enzyme